jgi:hypothetical protein
LPRWLQSSPNCFLCFPLPSCSSDLFKKISQILSLSCSKYTNGFLTHCKQRADSLQWYKGPPCPRPCHLFDLLSCTFPSSLIGSCFFLGDTAHAHPPFPLNFCIFFRSHKSYENTLFFLLWQMCVWYTEFYIFWFLFIHFIEK